MYQKKNLKRENDFILERRFIRSFNSSTRDNSLSNKFVDTGRRM